MHAQVSRDELRHHIQNLKYAKVGIISKPTAQLKQTKEETVQYASLNYNAVVKQQSPDASVCLDQILIQLRYVAPDWRKLGEAVGMNRLQLDHISQYVAMLTLMKENRF